MMQRDLFDTPETEELREEAHDDWWDDYADDEDERCDEDDGYDDEDDEDDTRKTYSDYISSLEDNAPHAEDVDGLTRLNWEAWIRHEAEMHDEYIDDEDIERIIRILDDDGYVRREHYDD